MSELIKKQVTDARALMEKAIDHCEGELQKIRAGKASPSMLDDIVVDYYGSPTPLNQVGSVNTPDARTIVIQPWEKSLLSAIEKAIMEANLGVNPQNDGVIIRINVPPLTEERRRDLVKKAKAEAETGKIAIRNIRKEANEKIRNGIRTPVIMYGVAIRGTTTNATTANSAIAIRSCRIGNIAASVW